MVISPPSGDAMRASPLIGALLAQLVAECAVAADVDHLGRARKRELLVVIGADASAALGVLHEGKPLIPAHAPRNGCRLLMQARCIARAPLADFDTITIGPLSEPTSARLSELGGSVRAWHRPESSRPVWKDVVFPIWERSSHPIVPPRNLACAQSEDAFLFLNGLAPIRAEAVRVDVSQATFANAAALASAAHDWTAPPLARVEATMPAPATSAPATAKPIGAQIRKALTRTPPPASKSKAKSP